MRKSVIALFLFGILLVSPVVLAQEQAQVYSGFDRFVDNVKLFFTPEQAKVELALKIREKEVNSALANIESNNVKEVNKNLENAMNKLLIVQEKVSLKSAGEVTDSVEKVVGKIEESNLSEELNRYLLEEKKTQLVAELVVEVDGKEGQTLTREIVKNGIDGRKMVKIEIAEENGQVRVMEIEEGIVQINNQIAEHTYAGGKGQIVEGSGGESKVVVEGDNNGVKTGGYEKDEPLPTPDLNKINPDLYDPNARAPGDTIDETYDDEIVNSQGSCGDGVNCGSGDSGTPGTNDIAPAVDSNSGDI